MSFGSTIPLLGLIAYLGCTMAASAQTPNGGITQVADHWPLLTLVWGGIMGALAAVIGAVVYYKKALAEVDERVKLGVAAALEAHIKAEEKTTARILHEMELHRVQFKLLLDFLGKKDTSAPSVPEIDLTGGK